MLYCLELFVIVALLLAHVVAAQSNTSSSTASGASAQSPANDQSGEDTGTYRGADRVGGGVSAPRLIYEPDPEYSREARKAKLEGTVVLWLIVGTDGKPHNIRVQRSLGKGLDEQAVKAVQQWRFEPSKKNGQPVPVIINVEVNFRLYADSGLSPHPESAADPPRFPDVDIAKYPLIVKMSPASPTDADSSATARRAVVTEAGAQKTVTISCDVRSLYCLVPDAGTFPARWIEGGKKLEILGLENKQTWKPAQYTVAAEPTKQTG